MTEITIDSPSVQSYLSIVQGVINRMAANSAGCKTWCIALVSVILLIIADKGRPELVWLSLVPIVLFLFLDAYYLALERGFRDQYNTFIRKLHSGKATVDDVFIVSPGTGFWAILLDIVKAFASIAVWPFYGLLVLMLVIAAIWLVSSGGC